MAQNVNVVVAVSKNKGIGFEGRIPWRLRKDLTMFKTITLKTTDENKQNAVIMGRKTWLSIPAKFRPLPNRQNIVLSTTLSELPKDVHLANSFKKAMDLVSCGKLADVVENVFVIGGSSVYREAMAWPRCRIYLTRILAEFECDAFFPNIDENSFRKVDNPEWLPSTPQHEGDLTFIYEVYDKM